MHIALAVLVLIGLLILYFFVYLPKTTNHDISITVPSVEGMQVDKLDDFLVKRNLRYEINDSSYAADQPPMSILRQFPAAGSKVKEGRKIFVSINRKTPPTVPVPALADGSVVNADAVLRSNELKRGSIELVPGPFNIVKEMRYKGRRIEAGDQVPKGATIDLVVMDGGSSGDFRLPNLVGEELEDAKLIILGYNLNLGEVILVGDTTGGGVVIKQKPTPEENIKVGDAVDLWIGRAGAEVPDDEDEL